MMHETDGGAIGRVSIPVRPVNIANAQLLSPVVVEGLTKLSELVIDINKKIHSPEFVASVEVFRTSINKFFSSPILGQALQKMESIHKAAVKFANSPLMQYIATASPADIDKLLSNYSSADTPLYATNDMRLVPGADSDLESQIVKSLKTGVGTDALSVPQRQYLTWFLLVLMFFVNWLDVQNGVREELCFAQPKLFSGLTTSQAGKKLRSALCDVPFEALSSVRLVKGEGVRMREGPSMKASLIQITLEDNTPLQVIDGSNRDWLQVAVPSQDGVEGWISRKYTRPLVR